MRNLDTYTLAGKTLNVDMVLSGREVQALGGNITPTRDYLTQRIDGVRLLWTPKERVQTVTAMPLHESYELADITEL